VFLYETPRDNKEETLLISMINNSYIKMERLKKMWNIGKE